MKTREKAKEETKQQVSEVGEPQECREVNTKYRKGSERKGSRATAPNTATRANR